MKNIILRAGVLAAAVAGGLLATSGPATAGAFLSLSQTDGVSAGQSVSVSLGGLPADLASVAVGQCKAQVSGPADCNLVGTLMGHADGDGNWQSNGGYSITLVGSIGGVDCASGPGACTIAVTSLTNPSAIITSAPLSFG
ncbi:neocarzinostatin apoprotein domain-containing protein [Nocardia jejuensis]|uniref:neocarzinostatin apoprotein domain-containing protein n=1 Tax=Nocardia jejuensis TaxID=328049 RepID=UPI000830447D|nr:neocarzinostatin apoprotein domain-containing protein [Nocardia jejuensis]